LTTAFDAGVPVVPRGAVAANERAALAHGTVAVLRSGLTRLRLTGSGRVACLQGLVTCDVAAAGDGALRFGALLTPKGMIVATLWITVLGEEILVEAQTGSAAGVRDTFSRTLPPRLCRCDDVTAATTSLGLFGAEAQATLAAATGGADGPGGGGLPQTGRATRVVIAGAAVTAARVSARGVDGYDLVLPAHAQDAVLDSLRARGAVVAGPALLEERRILAGHPRDGAEVDERTLPQEVRLDELGGVSFEKGCYLGQETVARLHFRGHANRRLMGLVLGDALPALLPVDVYEAARPVGRLTSIAWSEDHGGYVGLAVLRREVPADAAVRLEGGADAVVRALPWAVS
jgi:tRNA-modifying protein YgfZ